MGGMALRHERVLCVEFERQQEAGGGATQTSFRLLHPCPLYLDPRPSGTRQDRAPQSGAGVHSARPRQPQPCAPASPGNYRQRALLDSAQSGFLGWESGEVRAAEERT